jgi:hypothetical protein
VFRPGEIQELLMKAKCLGPVALVATASLLLSVASCAHDQQLVSIAIQPSVETVGNSTTPLIEDQGFQVQLRALGSYIHPPVTKDITSQVTWASNTPQMFTVDSSGLLTTPTPLNVCGATLVSATVNTNTSTGGISSSGAIVTGYMTANLVCYTASGSGNNTDALTLTFAPNSAPGMVTSDPAGLSATGPGAFVAEFTAGSTVQLTATGIDGSSFVSWVGCDTTGPPNLCSVTMTTNRTVTVAFQ